MNHFAIPEMQKLQESPFVRQSGSTSRDAENRAARQPFLLFLAAWVVCTYM